jgi:hypothetical protein
LCSSEVVPLEKYLLSAKRTPGIRQITEMESLYPDTFTAACPLLKNSLIFIVLLVLKALTSVGYAICFTVLNSSS